MTTITHGLRVYEVMQDLYPRGSKYPMFEVSGPKTIPFTFWEPESLDIGYLDPLGIIHGRIPLVWHARLYIAWYSWAHLVREAQVRDCRLQMMSHYEGTNSYDS